MVEYEYLHLNIHSYIRDSWKSKETAFICKEAFMKKLFCILEDIFIIVDLVLSCYAYSIEKSNPVFSKQLYMVSAYVLFAAVGCLIIKRVAGFVNKGR